jgi:hypothetical protein
MHGCFVKRPFATEPKKVKKYSIKQIFIILFFEGGQGSERSRD